MVSQPRIKKVILQMKQLTITTKMQFLALLLLVTCSVCAEWVKVGSIVEPLGATNYIDPVTIRKDGNLRKVWEMQDLKQRDKDGVMSRRARTEFDCKNERYRILSIDAHSAPMARGETLYLDNETGAWFEIPPQSASQIVLKIVCAN
jgi:hypothetical protein